jgi:DNA-binding SARP family transcriptional activator/tetratricopeptide (TPR) repeat protein
MHIALLGPVTITVDDQRHSLPRAQARGLLTLLAMQAGRPVSLDAAVEALWGGRAPETARSQVQAYASAVRLTLTTAGAPHVLESGRFGYLLQLSEGQVDALRFAATVRDAQRAAENGERSAAVRLYREAVGLWTGEAFSDASGEFVERARQLLTDQRLAAVESLAALELADGAHATVAVELAGLAERHLHRERLVGLTMLALYRNGARTEALELYRRCRTRLAEYLGLEPGPDLQRLHRSILGADPALAARAEEPAPEPAAPASPRPAQLPAAPTHLIGRDVELGRLDVATAGGRPVVITGAGGVGKSALAVSWAHSAAHVYPDGQLYVNLRGFSPGEPMTSLDAVGRFLRALGVPGEQIPVDLDEAAGRLRTELTGRRLLMVLDNAVDAEQVRPLLPGDGGHAVLVTSRDRLVGLTVTDEAVSVSLGVLDRAEATAVLHRLLPDRRLTPDQGERIADLCGRLPLALRIAAARLRDDDSLTGPAFVDALSNGNRLGALGIDGDPQAAVRPAFDLSYARLDGVRRRVFRLLGLQPGGEFGAAAVAAAADLPTLEAQRLLDDLVAGHLVEPVRGDRFGMHDLIRAYAIERAAAEEPPAAIHEARGRLFAWYLRHALGVAAAIAPEAPLLPAEVVPVAFADAAAALAWFDAERQNVLAAVAGAAQVGLSEYAWRLPDAMRIPFWHTRRLSDWLHSARHALGAAEADDDPQAVAAAHLSLGWFHFVLGNHDAARRHYLDAVQGSRQTGWVEAEISALNNLARTERDLGLPTSARSRLRRSLRLERSLARGAARESFIHATLASLLHQTGSLDEAVSHARRAIVDDVSALALAAHRIVLAEVLCTRGDLDEAADCFRTAQATFRAAGHRAGQAKCATGLGVVAIDAGREAEAAVHLAQALALARDADDPAAEADVEHLLGRLALLEGDPTRAVEHQRASLRIGARLAGSAAHTAALIGLSTALAALGRHDEAAASAQEALALARSARYEAMAGQAEAALSVARA